MHLKQIRDESIRAAKKLGVDVPLTLPLLDAGMHMRNANEVASRILAMNVLAATAYGFDKATAISWLNKEALAGSLGRQEESFLFEGAGLSDQIKVQIEGMWALAWAMGIVHELNFTQDCDNRFVVTLPNLKQGQSSTGFREKVKPRPLEQIVAACDLAYCLHWAVRQAELSGNKPPGSLKYYVLRERRRALEWRLSEDAWEEISLDT